MRVVISLIISLFFAETSICQLYDLDAFLNPSEAYDYCQDLKFNENGEMLVLHQHHNFAENLSGPAEFMDRQNFNEQSYSVLYLFDSTSALLNKLVFPCSDSLYYYAFDLDFLSNGTIAVLGHVYDLSVGKYDIFYANVAEDLSGFNQLKIFKKPLTTEHFLGFHKKSNANYLIYYNQPNFSPVKDCLLEIDINGNELSELLDFGSGYYSGIYLANSYYFNDKFYHYAGYDDFISIDNNNAITFYPNGTNNFNNDFYPFTKSGGILGNSYYINASKGIYNEVIKYHIDNSFEVIFKDTLSFVLKNGFSSVFSIANRNNMYSAFSFTDSLGGLVLYNIDTSGNLNWKKVIRLDDYNLSNGDDIVVQHVEATHDHGCLVTFGVKDQFDRIDCYALKVDSLGEQSDIFTGLFSRVESSGKTYFSLYPNPSIGEVNINVQNYNLTGKESIEFFTAKGEQLGIFELSANDLQLALSSKAKGVIYYRILDENKMAIQKGQVLLK